MLFKPLYYFTQVLGERAEAAVTFTTTVLGDAYLHHVLADIYAGCLALKKVDSQKSQKMIKFQSLPRQKRQAIRDEVLRMYAETDLSYGEIAEENGVQLRTVEYIVRNFACELPTVPTMRKKKNEASSEDYDKLRAEVTRLRKELRQEKMRAEALDTMIDVAEEMFNISVRKKAGTKQ